MGNLFVQLSVVAKNFNLREILSSISEDVKGLGFILWPVAAGLGFGKALEDPATASLKMQTAHSSSATSTCSSHG